MASGSSSPAFVPGGDADSGYGAAAAAGFSSANSSSSSPSASVTSSDTSAAVAAAVASSMQGRERLELLVQFGHPDSIMEPRIKASIAQFVRVGGDPTEAIRLMADGYVGYADMADVVSGWLVSAGMTAEEVSDLTHSHIQSLILQTFDVQCADAILNTGRAPWLNEMIQYPTWRQLIYHLSQQYPSSPLLNLFIKRISSVEGYLDEISQVTAVANEVDVFSDVVAHSISKLLSRSTMELDKSLPDFCRIACQSQHTYLYTQCLLHSAIPHHPRNAALLKRLTQELQSFSATTHHQRDVWQYALYFNHDSTAFPAVVSTLQAILSARELLPNEIARLHELYSRPSPPPVELLRIPALFELFVTQLFTSQTSSLFPRDHLSRCIFVLAYAASARDEVAASGYVRSSAVELHDTIAGIETAVGSLKEAVTLTSALAVLQEALKVPVVSQGVLYWLRGIACDPEFFSSFNNPQIVPPHLALLDQMATHHELLHPPAFALLAVMFDVPYTMDPLLLMELRRLLIDRMVYILSLGHFVLPVMAFIHERVHTSDLSLTLHFIAQILPVCSAPFSAPWVEAFMRIVSIDTVTTGLKQKGSAMQEAMLFLCRGMTEAPDLPQHVRALVTRFAEEMRKK